MGDLTRIASVGGIVFEKVSEGLGVCDVVDTHYLKISFDHCSLENQPPDSAETVNPYFDSHIFLLKKR